MCVVYHLLLSRCRRISMMQFVSFVVAVYVVSEDELTRAYRIELLESRFAHLREATAIRFLSRVVLKRRNDSISAWSAVLLAMTHAWKEKIVAVFQCLRREAPIRRWSYRIIFAGEDKRRDIARHGLFLYSGKAFHVPHPADVILLLQFDSPCWLNR